LEYWYSLTAVSTTDCPTSKPITMRCARLPSLMSWKTPSNDQRIARDRSSSRLASGVPATRGEAGRDLHADILGGGLCKLLLLSALIRIAKNSCKS